MKKIQLNKGLSLNKEAITKLQESQLSNFKGGINRVDQGLTCGNASCAASCNKNSCNAAQLQ
ncbi:class I lanthipeptide [Flavobacterium jumunjinense]|uniref:Class I lanthipeptide n=1 Tax=Flavobacterium jumunjinense TaxID=998845 RepID=A0ABV5GR90_9FLAO|nr:MULTISPECIES: class I lanthipeptide [Flavobacterium]